MRSSALDAPLAAQPFRRLRPLRRRSAVLLLVPLLLAPGRPAAAVDTPLQTAVGQEVARALRDTAALGVHIVEVTGGDTVYGYNADELRVTASNTKLFTTAAVLDALGPGYLFETRFLSRGRIENGVLVGDLGVVGGGDPSLSGRFYDGDAFAVFRPWARELRARGVKRVDGDVYLDHGLFEALQIHPDWPREQLASWYEAPIDALSFSDNCILVRVLPAAKKGAAQVELVPRVRGIFRVENTARTTTSRRRQKLLVYRHGDVLTVSGSIRQKSGPLEVWVTVPDPVLYFGAGLVSAFAEEGIEVRGKLRPVERLPGPVWERVAVAKDDLATALRVCNKHSQNFYAESLLKLLGALRCGEGSWREGVRAVSEFLTGIGVPAGSFHMTDGSGLSRDNRFSPRQVTQLLRAMFLHPWGSEFVQSLPLAGDGDGSLHHRMLEPPYRGNVFAKTGTIDGVSALSGYAKAVSGKTYAFSLLLNRTHNTAAARAAQDRIVMALVDHG